MDTVSSQTCAAPGCSLPVVGLRCDKVYCTDACRVRAFYHRHPDEAREHARDRMRERRALLRPHPARGTHQYADFRIVWQEYVGYHWQRDTAAKNKPEAVEERWYMLPGHAGDDDTLTHDPYAIGWA